MPLKIKQEHYKELARRVLSEIDAHPLSEYRALGLSEKRWRWDMVYRSGSINWLVEVLYKYLDDTHIDSALRRIVRDHRGN